MAFWALTSDWIYPGLPAAGGVLCGLVFVALWKRAREAHLLLWGAVCATQAGALVLATVYEQSPRPAWMSAFLSAQLLALLLVGFAMWRTKAWIDRQNRRVQTLLGEMERLRQQSRQEADMDGLTGLLNRSALAKRMENRPNFRGVVTVCDMDNFKEINDRYGHLVGDEILRNVGQLLRASVRAEDEAFRWGGDEFVVLFYNQNEEVAKRRMEILTHRLREFQVRGQGVVPLSFSWGTAEGKGSSLREALDQADREMYNTKRGQTRRTTGEAASATGSTGG